MCRFWAMLLVAGCVGSVEEPARLPASEPGNAPRVPSLVDPPETEREAVVDGSRVVDSSFPAGLACLARKTAAVTFENIGTTTWESPVYTTNGRPLPRVVAPGQRVTVDVPLEAPAAAGALVVAVQLRRWGVGFGERLERQVEVSCGCSFPQGVAEADFIAQARSYGDTDPNVDAQVNAAMRSLTGCELGSHCPLSGYAGANVYERCQRWFAAVNAALRAQGLCAGLHEEGHTDEIAVSSTGCRGRWYGYHVCHYGGPNVVWSPGARRGWWQIAPSRCP